MKLIYFDFEDSFSWNIIKYLEEYFNRIEIVSVSDFTWKTNKLKIEDENFFIPKVYLFGPGPKRPADYQNLLPFIQSEIKKEKNFLVGICLGHQAIMQSCGFAIGYSKFPSHGIQVSLALNEEWKKLLGISQKYIFVQRYNSLCIRGDESLQKINDYKILLDEHYEIMIFHFKNILSFQFHPESIGTKNPEYFFRSIKKLSMIYGEKVKNGR